MRKAYPSDISREQFEKLWPLLESARERTSPRTVDLYEIFCDLLYVLKSGCRWRMLPEGFPKWQLVYYYWRVWNESKNAEPSLQEQALKVLVDGGYTGEPFAQAVKGKLGASVEVAKRNKPHKFSVIPKRRIVERSFAWLDKCRRLWKNCERKLSQHQPPVCSPSLFVNLAEKTLNRL